MIVQLLTLIIINIMVACTPPIFTTFDNYYTKLYLFVIGDTDEEKREKKRKKKNEIKSENLHILYI